MSHDMCWMHQFGCSVMKQSFLPYSIKKYRIEWYGIENELMPRCSIHFIKLEPKIHEYLYLVIMVMMIRNNKMEVKIHILLVGCKNILHLIRTMSSISTRHSKGDSRHQPTYFPLFMPVFFLQQTIHWKPLIVCLNVLQKITTINIFDSIGVSRYPWHLSFPLALQSCEINIFGS